MKGENKRNFEAGILTGEEVILDAAAEQFDDVWRGATATRDYFCRYRF